MIIYHETKADFIKDVDNNVLRPRLEAAFKAKTGSVPRDKSVWAEEYSRFSLALRNARVDDEIQVAIEYHISAAGRFRIDVLLAGNDGRTDNGMIVELKAWDRAGVSDVPDMVISPIGGDRVRQHPCVQARKYKGLILRFNQDITEKNIQLHAAAYLFNLTRRNPEPLEDARYRNVLSESRLFLADDAANLSGFIEEVVPRKPKQDVLFWIENGRLRPTDALIDRVSSMLDGNEEFELIDEQNEAFQIIRHQLVGMKDLARRHVFVVEGGPGTGKSVIAVRLLAEILKKKRMGFLVAPNKAFRDTLVEFMARGNKGYREDGQALIRSSWSFDKADSSKDTSNEVLIVDEAHRLKDRAYQYRGKSMVEDMVRAARITVFFIDESQRVSWNDTGSVEAIKIAAQKYNAIIHEPFQLTAQYRCNGSTGYLNWLDDVLQIRKTGNFDNWGDGQYEFKIFDRAKDLYAALKAKNGNNKARLVAGYSWEWPTQGRDRGTTRKHVEADGLSLPWNYDGENWATSKDGIAQVGCIHTSQGIEFDWLGVLIGADLAVNGETVIGDPSKRARTDQSLKGWKAELDEARGHAERERKVMDKVQEIIKSTYRVLLSRGRKGCYVWCADEALREYMKSRLVLASAASEKILPFRPRIVGAAPKDRYVTCVPLVPLKVAASRFSDPQHMVYEDIEGEDSEWVAVESRHRLRKGMFVAQVVGKSMEPTIPDGSYCLFVAPVTGTRLDQTVLVQLRDAKDPETGEHYTVKRYKSEKRGDGDSWRHDKITLKPVNRAFEPIVLTGVEGGTFRVIAEFVEVLGNQT